MNLSVFNSTAEFLNISTIDILDWIILCGGAVRGIAGCLAASVASTHQIPVAPALQVVITTDISRHYEISPVGECKIIAAIELLPLSFCPKHLA